MRKITSFFLSMLLAVLAMPLQAAVEPEVSIDQEFTDLASLDGKAFAIVNKETGKALFGSNAQNLAYDVLSKAFVETNSGYYFKLAAPSEDASDESIASCYLLRLVTPAGEDYNLWGNQGCCLNSQTATGSCSFILGLSDKNGQDIKNGAVFDIKYVDGKGFTLLNKGTGKYLNDNAPAKYDEPVYWTFCTLKKSDPAAGDEELLPLTNEIATAKALGVDVSAWEGKTYLLSEVANAVNEVKVAEYNHVVGSYPTNAASLIPDFAAWEGGMAPNKGQHWDGTATSTYYEQAGDQWGQNSWTNSKTTKVTLPKGKYVLYAAGRASAGDACSSYIKMNETTVKFPSNGDVGLGINTSGAASFDSNDTFANGNKGRGFEYRYIAFEVTAEEGEEITLAVGGEATSQHQWMSICVPTLLTTADNVGLLKATLTKEIESAKTIVDAKANVGNALFCIPETAYNTFAAAVEAAQAANDNAEATAETLAAARKALADAVAAYQATPVIAPAAGKQYILSLNVPEGNAPVAMSITSDKISVESTGTPVTFAAQGNGGYALSNGTEYVVYDGSNTWTLKAAADAYAWTIAPVEGGYTIQGKNGLLGTNKTDVAAGTTCYGNKKSDDGNVVWSIAEYIAKYNVSVAEGIENGTVAVDAAEAEEGATVTITATPAEGYELEAISVKNGEADVEVSAENTFIMPAANVVVSATFALKAPELASIADDIKIIIPENAEVEDDFITATLNGMIKVDESIASDAQVQLFYSIAEADETEVPGGEETGETRGIEPEPSEYEFVDLKSNVESQEFYIPAEAGKKYVLTVKSIIVSYFDTKLDDFVTAAEKKYEGESKFDVEFTTAEAAPAETYAITIAETENGTVATDVAEAAEGTLVSITVTPAEGCKLEGIVVMNGEEEVEVVDIDGYKFTMPAAPVTVSATFVKEQEDFIAEEFTSVESLYNQAFAIVNKETGKVLYGSKDQNLGYDVPANAFVETNSGYYFKIDKAASVEGNLLRLMTPAGAEYTFWGDKKGYLNSQPATGWCSFILDLNNQNGQDIENGAVWEIEYVDGKGFTLKNVGTGLYLNDAAPAKYEEPAYWTFCTIKGFEAPEVTTGIDAVGAAKAANGKYVENGKVYIVKDGKKISVAGFSIK